MNLSFMQKYLDVNWKCISEATGENVGSKNLDIKGIALKIPFETKEMIKGKHIRRSTERLSQNLGVPTINGQLEEYKAVKKIDINSSGNSEKEREM